MIPIIVLLVELALAIFGLFVEGIAGLLAGLLLVGLTVLFFYNAAKNKQQMSFVKEGSIEFVVAGETLLNVLENVRGWHYKKGKGYLPYLDENGDEKFEKVKDAIVPDFDGNSADPTIPIEKIMNGPSRKLLLEEKFGLFWVSALYPLRKIFKFPVVHLRLKPEAIIPRDAQITDWLSSEIKDENGVVIPGDITMETSLLWRFPRPVLARDVEFAGAGGGVLRANILVLCYFQMIMPRPLVFELRERFFSLLERVIQGAIIDHARTYTGGFNQFINSATGSQSPFFWEALEPLNHINEGLIKRFGVYLSDAVVVQKELSDQDARTQEAVKANELARLEGEAAKTAANAKAEAIKTVAKAEAEALRAQLDAAPEAVIIEKLRKEAIEGNKTATTLVERGAIQVLVQKP